MKNEQLLEEIREANLNYLLLSQALIRQDRAAAVYRLGIGEDVAEVLETLSTSQLVRIAASNTLLCRFRFDDKLILDLLVGHGKEKSMGAAHAAILMARRPVEAMA